MAPDKLTQIGKYIKETGDNTDRALKKQRPIRPTVERARDIFDTEVPFTMQFNVTPKQKRISCDLEFNKPPPRQNCNTGTDIKSYCETFTVSGPGSGEFTLLHPPIKYGSLKVYVNGVSWPSTSFLVLDSSNVLVSALPLATNTVVICYVKEFEFAYDSIHEGPLNNSSYISNANGYIFYCRAGIGYPDDPTPYFDGDLRYSDWASSGPDGVAVCAPNQVRILILGDGTATVHLAPFQGQIHYVVLRLYHWTGPDPGGDWAQEDYIYGVPADRDYTFKISDTATSAKGHHLITIQDVYDPVEGGCTTWVLFNYRYGFNGYTHIRDYL